MLTFGAIDKLPGKRAYVILASADRTGIQMIIQNTTLAYGDGLPLVGDSPRSTLLLSKP